MEEEQIKAGKEKRGKVAKAIIKTPSLLKKPIRFLGQIVASGVKTIGSFILIILFFSLLGGVLSGPLATQSVKEEYLFGEGPNKILVIPLEGIILNQPQPFSGSTGTITPNQVRQLLKHAEDDENIKGVILELESPGGSAVASDRIFTIIANFRKKSGKPLVTLMGDTAASGGYYLAASTDRIVANPSTLTGSIGVIATTFNLEELMKKLGIKEEVFKKGEFKDILSSTREMTDEEREIIESILDDAYQQFIDRIAQGRNISSDQVQALATGRIFSGVQAKKAGLVDRLGNLDESVEEVKSLAQIKEAQVVRLETGGLLEQLFSGITFGWLARIFTTPPVPRLWYLMQ